MEPLQIAIKALKQITRANKKSANHLMEIANVALTKINDINQDLAANDPKANKIRVKANSKNMERSQSIQSEIIEIESIINNQNASPGEKAEGQRQLDRLKKMLADPMYQQI